MISTTGPRWSRLRYYARIGPFAQSPGLFNTQRFSSQSSVPSLGKLATVTPIMSSNRRYVHILIELSPCQHLCCIVSLNASFCSINPQYLPFLLGPKAPR